jgi:hypothetical protein
VDLWAKFPGKLDSNLTTQFSFFNLDHIKENSEIQVTLKNETLIFDESVTYSNFKFSSQYDQVEFNIKRIAELRNTSVYKDVNLTHINQGLLETLMTLTKPQIYEQGLNALNLLLNKAIGSSEDFIKKLFTVFAFDYLIKEKQKVLNTILRNFYDDLAENIYSGNEQYSLGR